MSILRDKQLERKISNQNLVEFAENSYSHSHSNSDSGGHDGKSSPDPIRKKLIEEVENVKYRITKQFPKLSGDHNVLVIGAHDVGKSSLINSLWLSMTGETEERSPPVGKPYNFSAVPIYRRKSHYSRNGGIKINGGSLQFWDTRGFEKIHSISLLATLFRFILEGRMPTAYFHQALMLPEQVIIKNCKKIEINRNKIYKAVVFIERENPSYEMEEQTTKLAEALKMGLSRSKFHAVKNVPVIRVKNGAEKEVRSLAKSMSSVSSVESLNEIGMPGRQHNIESYTWSVNYTDYDLDEIDTDDSDQVEKIEAQKEKEKRERDEEETNRLNQEINNEIENSKNEKGIDEDDQEPTENNNYYLKMNIKPSSRFEFSYRLGPDETEITPEKHLSLLLFLSNLLTIMVYPDSNESKKWRMDKNVVAFSDQQISCTNVLKNILFKNNSSSRYRSSRN